MAILHAAQFRRVVNVHPQSYDRVGLLHNILLMDTNNSVA